MSAIFFFSSLPGTKIPSIFSAQSIFAHLIVYFVLGLFFSRAIKYTYPNLKKTKIVLITLIFGIIYGLSDEFHQAFVPMRNPDIVDLVIDSIGSLLGGII